jgi:hypothetical protein
MLLFACSSYFHFPRRRKAGLVDDGFMFPGLGIGVIVIDIIVVKEGGVISGFIMSHVPIPLHSREHGRLVDHCLILRPLSSTVTSSLEPS